MKEIINSRFAAIIVLIVLAVSSRLVHHIPNFTPIAALALFGGAYFKDKRLAFIIPLAIMLISDLFLGFHYSLAAVYLGFAIAVLIGFALKQNITVGRIIAASISSSIIFFILTNFSSWLIDPFYHPLSIKSLISCYTLALPFFRNSLIGDLVYSGVIFGAFSLAEKYIPTLSTSKVTIN